MSPAAPAPVGRDLRPLFEPHSVAVVGASNDPEKWGHWLAKGALRGAHRRPVYLVNKNGGEIIGRPAFRSLAEVPEPAECVVVAVPAAGFEEAVEGALAAGARAIIGVTSGLGELGSEGQAREASIARVVREAGAVLLGPNCLGVFDAAAELDLGWSELPAGSIGLISQSGNLALELGLLAADYGLGFSRFASLGNQADLEAAALVAALAAHDPTRVIALYCEDFRDGRAFASAAEAAVRAGKTVLLLAAEARPASIRAARSHTGALVSDTVAVAAACRAAGIVRVATPKELVDTALAALSRHVPRGRRVAVVGDGGGHGVVAADTAARAGLDLPTLSQSVRDRLSAVLPKTASTSNPVDFAGGGEESRWMFEQAIRIVLESGEVDAALLTGYFGGYSAISDDFREEEVEVARALAQAATDTDRPLVVQSMYPSSPSMIALRAEGVPTYREIEAAASAVARLVHLRDHAPTGVPTLPRPARELARSDDPGGGYFEARALLAGAGVQFPRAVRASSLEEARAAAAEVGYPIVLKALGLLHKSDAGGVVLGISDEEGLVASFSKMATELVPGAYSIERMAPLGEGVELIVGCRRDARFGPILLVGLGGLYAELLEDVGVALAPVDAPQVESLLRSLRGAGLLTGARGRRALDLRAAAEVASALSQCAAAHPEVSEIEINPLLVTADAALALDSRLVIRDERGADAS